MCNFNVLFFGRLKNIVDQFLRESSINTFTPKSMTDKRLSTIAHGRYRWVYFTTILTIIFSKVSTPFVLWLLCHLSFNLMLCSCDYYVILIMNTGYLMRMFINDILYNADKYSRKFNRGKFQTKCKNFIAKYVVFFCEHTILSLSNSLGSHKSLSQWYNYIHIVNGTFFRPINLI